MFTKIILGLIFIFLSATSILAFDSPVRPYIGVIAGSTITPITRFSDVSGAVNIEINPGFLGGLTVGAALDEKIGFNIDRLRLEAEIAYRTSELIGIQDAQGQIANVNGSISMTNFMLNGYLENSGFEINDMPISLFLTAGVGAAIASITEISYRGRILVASGKSTQLAYQGGLGVGSQIAKNTVIDATYKYIGTDPFSFSGVRAEYGSHNLVVGVRHLFN